MEEVGMGDTVIPTFLAHCKDCADCKSERSNLCSKLPFNVNPGMPRDGTTRFTDSQGNPVHNFLFVSSFSQYTVVDVAHLTKVEPGIPLDKACLLGCGISTGMPHVHGRSAIHRLATLMGFFFFFGFYNLATTCDLTAGVGAAWKVAQVEAGSSVAIFGLGAVGLAVMPKNGIVLYY